MKCEEIRKRIDLELIGSSFEIDSVLKSHIDGCEECGLYYKVTAQLRAALNSQEFRVLPGELDEITFEKIAVSKVTETVRPGFGSLAFKLRWAWVPAAAAAIIIMFMVFPKTDNIDNLGALTGSEETAYLVPGVYVNSEQEAARLAQSLMADDSEIETLSDELIYGSEIDDLIESLTDDEFEVLYDRLKNINGSSG